MHRSWKGRSGFVPGLPVGNVPEKRSDLDAFFEAKEMIDTVISYLESDLSIGG